MDSWAAEMGHVLSKISHEEPVEPEMEEHLQVKMLLKMLVPQILILQHGFVAGVKRGIIREVDLSVDFVL